MPSILHTLKSKGLKKTLERFLRLFFNLGIDKEKVFKNTKEMINLCNTFNQKPSFPITSVVYEKHKDKIDNIGGDFELCAHGLMHTNHRDMSFEQKYEKLNQAFTILSTSSHFHGGFRAPYLSRDNNLSKALAETQFQYDSSYNVFTKYNIKNLQDIYKILRFYDSKIDVYKVPYRDNDIIQIPVNLPDDQILIDVENFSSGAIFKIWKKILLESIKNRTIFVLQLHPERFHLLEDSLRMLLIYSKKFNVWRVSMHEISDFFKSNETIPREFDCGLSITGDIDVFNLEDYSLMYGN